MAYESMRHEAEHTVRELAAVGVFHRSTVSPYLTAGEVGEIAMDSGADVIDAMDGWTVNLSSSTLVCTTLRRIAGALGGEPSLCRVPRHEVALAVVKAIDHGFPHLSGCFEFLPGDSALDALFYLTGCRTERDWVDFSTVPNPIKPQKGHEEEILHALMTSFDCNLTKARLLRAIGMSGGRTKLTDKILPSVPFIAGGSKGEPIRLIGQRPHPLREARRTMAKREAGTYMGLTASEDGHRLLVAYRLTEEAVETASFHIPQDAKQTVAGTYAEERSGIRIGFNINTKHARKLSGLRSVILRNFPDYVAGQHAYILLDKANGTARVEVLDAIDYEGQDRMRDFLEISDLPGMAA